MKEKKSSFRNRFTINCITGDGVLLGAYRLSKIGVTSKNYHLCIDSPLYSLFLHKIINKINVNSFS